MLIFFFCILIGHVWSARQQCNCMACRGQQGQYQLVYNNQGQLEYRPIAQQQYFDSVMGNLALVRKLGSGSYGKVYEAQTSDGHRVALKLEYRSPPNECVTAEAPPGFLGMAHEYRVLWEMQGVRGFPTIYGKSFNDPNRKYYIMEMLTQNIGAYAGSRPGGVIPSNELRSIGVQIVNSLEALHMRGYLMYDIHPGNVMVHEGVVYMVDLAWANPITGKPLLPSKCRHMIYGTVKDTGHPKDDLIKVTYLLVHLANGYLAWQSAPSLWHADAYKRSLSTGQVCSGQARWVAPAYRYARGLSTSRNVDYDYFRQLLMQ